MIAGLRRFADGFASKPVVARWVPAVLWALTIWWLSSRPPKPGTPGLLVVFVLNGGHVVLFGTLALLVHAATAKATGVRRFLFAAALAASYGAIDEIHQAYVPGRDSSVFDWCSDCSGAVLAAAAATWIRESQAWAWRLAWAAVPVALASVTCATFC